MPNIRHGIYVNAILLSTALMYGYCAKLHERVTVRWEVMGLKVNTPFALAAVSTVVLVLSLELILMEEEDTAVVLADLSDQLLVVSYLVRCAQVFKGSAHGRRTIKAMMALSVVATLVNLIALLVELPDWADLLLELSEALCFSAVLVVFVLAKVVAGRAKGLSAGEVWHSIWTSSKVVAAFVLVVHEPVGVALIDNYGEELIIEGIALSSMHLACYVSERKLRKSKQKALASSSDGTKRPTQARSTAVVAVTAADPVDSPDLPITSRSTDSTESPLPARSSALPPLASAAAASASAAAAASAAAGEA